MLIKNRFALFVFCVICEVLQSNGDRIKDTMYEKINSSMACYRRMNATHQIGCSSKRGGSIGVVHYCDTYSDLDFIFKNGIASPYIPVMPTKLFNVEIVRKMEASEKVSGLVLYDEKNNTFNFSHEDKCPNNRFSVDGTCPSRGWNPWGTGLLYRDIAFPMFYIEDENEVSKIKECFKKFNNFSFETQRDRSLCSIELNSFMYAATNTPTCKRRSNIITNLNPVKLCDPLGDRNVWGSLFPLVEGPENSSIPVKEKYIVIAARMDTTSLFEKTTGAESPITGLVTLLTVAKLLKEMLPNRPENVAKNILFILFNGETYDYIGSQRLLYDMENGYFPVDLPPDNELLPIIYPDNITLFIELSQFGKGEATYAHYLSTNNRNELISQFIIKLNSTNNVASLPVLAVADSLPPSSLHTFIKENTTVQGLVLTNHKSEFRNHFYNSYMDSSDNILYKYYNGSDIPDTSVQKYVGDVALTVAKSVYGEIMNVNYSQQLTVDLALVDELFHCYLENRNCKLHRAIQKAKLPSTPANLYVGVDVVENYISNLIALTLAYFTGDVVGESGPNCTNLHKNHVYRYYNMSVSMDNLEEIMCYRATVNVTEAVSPAFIIEDYDWSSNKYSSWSESTWHDISMRMFLKPSTAHENTTIAIGSMTMIFSFLLVYFMKSRSHILFSPAAQSDPPANC